MSPDTEHLAPENPGARCRHLAPGTSPKPGKWGVPEKNFQNALQECLFQVASALQSKVLAQTWFPELNEGVIFEQNTISNICLLIKM